MLLALAGSTLIADTMVVTMKDGKEVRYDTDKVASVRFEKDSLRPEPPRDDRPRPGKDRHFSGDLSMTRDAWDVISGDWDWNGGTALCRSTSNSDTITYRALYRGLEMRNGVIVAKVDIGDGGYNDVGVLFRMRDSGNGYGVRLQKDGFISLRKIKGGNGEHIKAVHVNVNPAVEHSIRIELNDDRILVYLDGKLLIERSDMTYLDGGKIGVMQDRGSNGRVLGIRAEAEK